MVVEDPHEESIKVCCRFRPENQLEREHGGRISVDCPDGGTSVYVAGSDLTFVFDRVFRWDANQKEVYDYAAKPIINAVLRGFNGTVFAYGQTASGKTFTMEGPDIEDKTHQGVIPRMVWSIFDGIYHADEHIEFLVKVSIVEIYNERIRDLLDPKRDNLKVHEDKARGVFIGEVTESYVGCEQEIFDAMRAGHYNRSMAVTNMNEHSSRSHLVFMLTVEQKNLHDRSVKVGKLHLVDLAGSEKVAKTGASGERLDEAKNINRSLSALGNVINALTDKKYTHVPYRDSKLTRVLQESLGGNAKTSLIITCSPSNFNEQETISTLRFGQRAKMIKNVVKVNHERSAEELKLLLEKKDFVLNELSAKCVYLENVLRQNGIPVPENTSNILAGVITEQSREDMAELMDELKDCREQLELKEEQMIESNRERDELLRQMGIENERLTNSLSEAREVQEQTEYESKEKVARLSSEVQRLKQENEALNMSSVHHALDDSMVSPDGGTGASSSTAGGRGVAPGAAAHRGTGHSMLAVPPSAGSAGSGRITVSPRTTASGLGSVPASASFPGGGRGPGSSPHPDTREAELALGLERLREPRDDRHVKRKVSQLDKNLEQLTVMYHKLVAQNSGLKVELAEVDKKIQRKDQRIGQLERNLKEMKQKYEKLMQQCANLTSAMDSSLGRGKPMDVGGQVQRHRNIIKPVKGGIAGPRPEAEGGYPTTDSSPVSDSPPRRRDSSRTRLAAGGLVRAPGSNFY